MALWRRGGFAENDWISVADDAPAPEGGAIVVSLKRWLADREALLARMAPVGVAVNAGADAQAHLADLADRPLVALSFARFADGRSFSYARMLRDRFDFKGELRAIGDVLIDEIPLMIRCGFDSFEVTNEPTLRALQAGRLPGPPIHYQPGSGGDETCAGSRPWLRASAGQASQTSSPSGRADGPDEGLSPTHPLKSHPRGVSSEERLLDSSAWTGGACAAE
jgi:phosphoadenosine phosphosulfate reductase